MILSYTEDEIKKMEEQMAIEDTNEFYSLLEAEKAHAMEVGRNEGIEIGEQKGIAKTILAMNKKGMDAKSISELLDIDINEVQEILDNK